MPAPRKNLTIDIYADTLEEFADAIKSAHQLVKAGHYNAFLSDDSDGPQTGVVVQMNTMDHYPHGDYYDGEQSLVHVGHNGSIITVQPAQGEKIEFEEWEPVFKWADEHGGLTLATDVHDPDHKPHK